MSMLSDEEIMQQVLEAFQEEQQEHRQAISTILLDLEHNPQHPQREAMVAQLFREAHSLKGGARAAGIEPVEQLAHRMEDVFSAVRQDQLHLAPHVCDAIYTTLEAIGELMRQVVAGVTPDIAPYQGLLERLGAALEAQDAAEEPLQPVPAAPESTPAPEAGAAPAENTPVSTPAQAPLAEPAAPSPPVVSQTARSEAQPAAAQAPATDEVHWETASTTVRLSTAMLDTLMNETGELITSAVRAQQRAQDARKLAELPARWKRTWRQVHPIMLRLQQQQPDLRPTVHHLNDREVQMPVLRTLDVMQDRSTVSLMQHDTVLLLEALLQANTMLNDLAHHLAGHARQSVEDSASLSAITNRLQDQIRRTRMLPVATLLNPLRVQLREMTRAAGKQVVLETDDGGAEADRQVLERLREVLLHLIRNAIDHGIEKPEVRTANGKPAVGRLTMRTMVSGDYLELTVTDDGAGLDIANIQQRALRDGLVNENDLTRVAEADLIDLIFLPGFSTRYTVDTLSGRGVGLDIVRSQVERMHGQVSVQSTPGAGCTFFIRVPLSLTSSHGLLLKVGKATYMLPLESVQRIVSVGHQDVHMVEGHAAIMLNDHPVTLIHLADLLHSGAERSAAAPAQPLTSGRWSLALLLGSGDRQIACLVDGVLGEQELVVHRLPAPLQRVRFVAGATILADGRVVPILDLVDVLPAANGNRGMITIAPETSDPQHKPTVVVVDDSITTRTLEKNILEAAGYQVHLAIDGTEALHVLHHLMTNGGCDLLLSDIDMPNLNGFDLTSQVRTDPDLKHLPIVLVTSLDTPADRERGLAAGADAYIVKRAFDQQTLLDTIARLI